MKSIQIKFLSLVFLLPTFSYGLNDVNTITDESAILIQEELSPGSQVRALDESLEKTPAELHVPIEEAEKIEAVVKVEESAEKKASSESYYLRVVRSLRERMPEKLGLVLSKVGVSESLKKQVVEDLTRRIDKAPGLIERSDSRGVRLQGHLILGIGVSEYLMKAFKSSRYGKWLPEKVSFGLSLAAGITILRVRQNGGSKIVIRLHSDIEKVDRILSFMAEGFAGVHGTLVKENMAEKVRLFEKVRYDGTNLGGMGKIIVSRRQFEYGMTAGIPLTPIISAAYIYETKGTQYRINLQLTTTWIGKIKEATKSFCRFFLSS